LIIHILLYLAVGPILFSGMLKAGNSFQIMNKSLNHYQKKQLLGLMENILILMPTELLIFLMIHFKFMKQGVHVNC